MSYQQGVLGYQPTVDKTASYSPTVDSGESVIDS
jgi:hypothetical protein